MASDIKLIRVEENPAMDIPGHTLCTGQEIAGELLGIKTYALKKGTFEQGGTAEEHTHEKAEHVFYVLTGALTVFANGQSLTAQAGEALHIPPGIPHSAENSYQGTTTYIALTIPPT